VERGLTVFFVALAHDLAREADRQLAAGAAAPVTTAQRFLEAMWRYYNLVDFAVGQRDPGASTAMRLAYDDAEAMLKTTPPPDRARVREAFTRMAGILAPLAR
jgi:hypothetical protein